MRRVVVTGIGILSPIGETREKVVIALRSGASAIVASPEYAALNFASRVWAPVTAEFPQVDRKLDRFMGKGRTIRFGYHAALRAVEDAALKEDDLRNPDTGCILGTGGPSTQDQIEAFDTTRAVGPKKVGMFAVPPTMSSGLEANVTTALGIKGVGFSITSACATSGHCIGEGVLMIAYGRQKIMVVGGSEDAHPSKACGFDAMGALTRDFNDNPAVASRAFDESRSGFVEGEGGGVLVLEEREHAIARGVHIYAEVVGYGATSDGHHMTDPSGEGAIRCMQMAMRGINPDVPVGKVDYVNAHGTSTRTGDIVESNSLDEVFRGQLPWVSSTKSITGHALGAAGALEAIYSLYALEEGFIPISAHIEKLDRNIAALAIGERIARETIDMPIKTVMSNAFGFGGTNASLVFQRHAD